MFKRLIGFSLSIILILSAIPNVFASTGTNLITNGDFEQVLSTNPPSVWASVTREITTVSEYVYSGNGALRWQQNATWAGGKWTNMALQKGKTYKISACFRLDKTVSANCGNIYFQLSINGSSVAMCGTGEIKPTDGYKKVEKVITLANTDITSKELVFNANPVNNAGVTFYVDNISILELNVATLTSSVPVNNAQDVNVNSSLSFTYNNNIDPASVSASNISITGGSSSIGTISVSGNTVNITPSEPLSPGTTYTAVVSGIKDVDGLLAADTTISFKTAGQPEEFPNMLIYGSFENSSINTPYFNVWNANNSMQLNKAGSMVYSSVYEHRGSYSAKLEQSTQYGSMSFLNFGTLVSGETYYASFWGRLDPATNAPGQKIKMWLAYNIDLNSDGDTADTGETVNQNIIATPSLSANQDFTFVSTFITIPQGTMKSTATLTFFSQEGTGLSGTADHGTFYIDDVVFKKAPLAKVKTSTFNSKVGDLVNVNATLDLTYNYDLNTTTVLNSAFTLNGNSNMVTVTADSQNPREVQISFNQPLNFDTDYSLTIDGLKDSMGRSVAAQTLTFKTVPQYLFDSVKFYKDGADITGGTLTAGNLTARVSGISNNTSEPGNVSVILVLYKDNAMYVADAATVTVAANTTLSSPLSADLTVPDLNDGEYKAAVMVWKDLINTTPVFSDMWQLTE